MEIIGRDREMVVVSETIDRSPSSEPNLVLHGDPGVGKTTLLRAGVLHAEGLGQRVITAAGYDVEVSLAYAGLHQLFAPIMSYLERLPHFQREVLRTAMGLEGGGRPDPLTVGSATSAALAEVAADGPVLIAVDDAHWVDRPTLDALAFMLRRSQPLDVRSILTRRTIPLPERPNPNTRLLDVLPLSEQASGEVLDRHSPGLSDRLRRRILADAAGNPLALLDLPEVYRTESVGGSLPGRGSVRTRLEAAYAAQLESLPAGLRQALLQEALRETHPSGAPVGEQPMSLAGDDLTRLEQSALVSQAVVPGRWTLRHPLVRAALIRSASPVELRAAHRLLAHEQEHQPERRIWHLGAASTAPDEAAATEIEAMAETVYGRGGSGLAALALHRAAELSADSHGGTRRMQRAAYMATESGDFDLATQMLREVRTREAESGQVFRDSMTRSLVLMFRDGDFGGVQEAAQHAATHDVDSISPEEREHLAQVIVHVAFFLGQPSAWNGVHGSIAGLAGPVGPDVDLSVDALTDQAGVEARLRQRFETVTDHTPPLHLGYLYFAVMHRDLLHQHRHHIDQLVERETDAGALAYAALGYEYSARDSYLAGDWDRCERLTLAGLELATSNDLAVSVQGLRCLLGFLAASRGDDRRAESYGLAVERWATARQGGFHRAIAVHVRGLAALSRGDHEGAHQHLQRISPGGDLCIASLAQWPLLDAVEAAVRTGRHEHAQSLVREADRRQVADLTPRLRVQVPAARALTEADGVQKLFAAALDTPEIASFPFDRARIHLLAGEFSRRHDTPAAARPDLRRAADLFTQLGATSWRGRAEQELRASGVGVGAGVPRPRRGPGDEQLTPQQREVAELAASGLSTKEIAQRLFLSPRTVSAHLYQVFPKLGITSRSALRDALTHIDPT